MVLIYPPSLNYYCFHPALYTLLPMPKILPPRNASRATVRWASLSGILYRKQHGEIHAGRQRHLAFPPAEIQVGEQQQAPAAPLSTIRKTSSRSAAAATGACIQIKKPANVCKGNLNHKLQWPQNDFDTIRVRPFPVPITSKSPTSSCVSRIICMFLPKKC